MSTRVIDGLERFPNDLRRCALTIGKFDGVHLGHRAILRRCRDVADADTPVVAMTFEPPPEQVLRPGAPLERLASLDHRCELLSQAGADAVLVARADMKLLGMEPDAFIDEVLVGRFGVRHVVEGGNFRFGRKRAGDLDTLRQAGPSRRFQVHEVPPEQIDLDGQTQPVSSSLIRELLAAGRIEAASRCLNRAYQLYGPVVHGHGRGRRLKYPTCNLDVGDLLVPADGVYAGSAQVDGQTFPAAISIGTMPTFADDSARAIEAHLLDAEGDYYGQHLRLDFHAYLRPQRAFGSEEELVEQMTKDVQHVRLQSR